jgi:glyoxylase-like metal-dependent hydrolase (beta-lactamase superfamily II)
MMFRQLFEPISSTYTCLVASEEGRPLELGEIRLEGLHAPGHTDDHFPYRIGPR